MTLSHRHYITFSVGYFFFCLTTLPSFPTMVSAFSGIPTNNPFKPKYHGGSGVGIPVVEDDSNPSTNAYGWNVLDDMILVERLQPHLLQKAQKDNGADGKLYIPPKDLPKLRMCRIISIGPNVNKNNNDNDSSSTNNEDSNVTLQPGDIVLVKDPWGIGPRDEELTDGTKLSYMKSINIVAKVSGGLLESEGINE